MAQQGTSGETPEQGYAETVAPQNPPNAVLQPAARSAALTVFLGGIVVLFLIVAAMLVFWRTTDQPTRADQREDSSVVGTTGDPGSAHESTPGGGDPAPDHNNTKDELDYRGGKK